MPAFGLKSSFGDPPHFRILRSVFRISQLRMLFSSSSAGSQLLRAAVSGGTRNLFKRRYGSPSVQEFKGWQDGRRRLFPLCLKLLNLETVFMGVIRSVADRRSWDPARTSGYENKVTGALFVLFRCLVQRLFQFFYHG
jgi:hypothetical protein